MTFTDPPPSAAWQHVDARDGFEVVFFDRSDDGHRITGYTSAVEDGVTWAVRYELDVSAEWRTRRATVSGHSVSGEHRMAIESVEPGRWLVNGAEEPDLDGCLDVDLEASALTNAFPVRRLGLAVGASADAPAVFVRAADLAVERLEQRYMRVADTGTTQQYDYAAPVFDFECRLIYDESGLVTAYPGLAIRAA